MTQNEIRRIISGELADRAMSYGELARKLGVTVQYVSNIMSGRRDVTPTALVEILASVTGKRAPDLCAVIFAHFKIKTRSKIQA